MQSVLLIPELFSFSAMTSIIFELFLDIYAGHLTVTIPLGMDQESEHHLEIETPRNPRSRALLEFKSWQIRNLFQIKMLTGRARPPSASLFQ